MAEKGGKSGRIRSPEPPSQGDTLPPAEAKPEIEPLSQEKERMSVLESIEFLDRRIGKIESKKRELTEELEQNLRLESFSKGLKEQYAKRLMENDAAIYRRLGIESEKTSTIKTEREYPILGVLAVGILLIVIGFLVLLPFDIPLTLRYIFGAGFLIVGFAVLANSLWQARSKIITVEQRNQIRG